ncbi:MAG: hypothetical protein WCN81_16200, partial [Actinomycetes bacterium]
PPLMESDFGEIWKVTPDGHATLVVSKDITPYGMLLGVAVRDDRVYVALYDQGAGTISPGVYRVDGRSLTQVVTLPAGAMPNGLAFHDGRLYITDSVTGRIWRTRVDGPLAEPKMPWLQDALLAPGGDGLGANGLAFRGDDLFVSVSDSGRIVRIPTRREGMPGAPRVVCERPELVSADGIAFDATGDLWITANHGTKGASPAGGLFRLSPRGALKTVADDPGWLNYPAMLVFGTDRCTRDTLYVENGAYFSAYGDGSQPDIQALRVGVPGLPLR